MLDFLPDMWYNIVTVRGKRDPHERLSLTTSGCGEERGIYMSIDQYFALREFAMDLYDDGLRAADIEMIADQYELEDWETARVEAFLREIESDEEVTTR